MWYSSHLIGPHPAMGINEIHYGPESDYANAYIVDCLSLTTSQLMYVPDTWNYSSQRSSDSPVVWYGSHFVTSVAIYLGWPNSNHISHKHSLFLTVVQLYLRRGGKPLAWMTSWSHTYEIDMWGGQVNSSVMKAVPLSDRKRMGREHQPKFLLGGSRVYLDWESTVTRIILLLTGPE